MDIQLDQQIRPQLSASERLLWSGRPATGLRLRASDGLQIPFSIVWCGFVTFWESQVLNIPPGNPAAIFLPLWGIPFILVGLYMLVGRFFWDAYVRGRTRYGLSDQRAIIITDIWSAQVKSLPLSTLVTTLSTRLDGTGTITLGVPMVPQGLWFGGRGSSRRYRPPAFEMIPDAQRVYQMIQDAQAKST